MRHNCLIMRWGEAPRHHGDATFLILLLGISFWSCTGLVNNSAHMWGTSKYHAKQCIFVRCLAPGSSWRASFLSVTVVSWGTSGSPQWQGASKIDVMPQTLFFWASLGALSQTRGRAPQGASDSMRLSIQSRKFYTTATKKGVKSQLNTAGLLISCTVGLRHNFCCRGPILIPRPDSET